MIIKKSSLLALATLLILVAFTRKADPLHFCNGSLGSDAAYWSVVQKCYANHDWQKDPFPRLTIEPSQFPTKPQLVPGEKVLVFSKHGVFEDTVKTLEFRRSNEIGRAHV